MCLSRRSGTSYSVAHVCSALASFGHILASFGQLGHCLASYLSWEHDPSARAAKKQKQKKMKATPRPQVGYSRVAILPRTVFISEGETSSAGSGHRPTSVVPGRQDGVIRRRVSVPTSAGGLRQLADNGFAFLPSPHKWRHDGGQATPMKEREKRYEADGVLGKNTGVGWSEGIIR